MEYSFRNASSFLTDEEVQDVFLMDNSATRQVTCKRGSGKLRHVSDASGKVLWCQEVISSREVEVKQVEQFTMCQIDRDGGRVGEKERQEVGKREREMQRKLQRLAKALEKIMYASSLGSVA